MGLLALLNLPPPPAGAKPSAAPPRTGASRGGGARKKPKPRRERNDAQLKELAKWPGDAHRVWKRLSGTERMALSIHMANRYGKDFAQQFLKFTESGARDEWATFGGPFPEYTPDWFKKRGYSLVQKDIANQWWAHPSGHVMVGQFGAGGEKRATEIADQKAFDAALAKLQKALEEARKAEAAIRGMQNFFMHSDATEADRPRQYDIYVKHLEDLESKAETKVAEAQGVRAKFASKGVDTSALNTVITDLGALGEWASASLAPDQLEIWAPRAPRDDVDLPDATDEPIDFSGKGSP